MLRIPYGLLAAFSTPDGRTQHSTPKLELTPLLDGFWQWVAIDLPGFGIFG